MTMNEHIANIEGANDVKVLSFVENGSRAWEYNSRFSDHDIKGVYVSNDKTLYHTFDDNEQKSITYQQGDVDVCLYDIRQFCKMLYNGNATAYEMLNAKKECHYRSLDLKLPTEFWNNVRRSLMFHYYGLAHKTYKNGIRNEEESKYQICILRPLLCVNFMLQSYSTTFPLSIQTLLESTTIPYDVYGEVSRIVTNRQNAVQYTPDLKILKRLYAQLDDMKDEILGYSEVDYRYINKPCIDSFYRLHTQK